MYEFLLGKSLNLNKWIIYLLVGVWCLLVEECYSRLVVLYIIVFMCMCCIYFYSLYIKRFVF